MRRDEEESISRVVGRAAEGDPYSVRRRDGRIHTLISNGRKEYRIKAGRGTVGKTLFLRLCLKVSSRLEIPIVGAPEPKFKNYISILLLREIKCIRRTDN